MLIDKIIESIDAPVITNISKNYITLSSLEYSRDNVYFGKYHNLFVLGEPVIRINIRNDIGNDSPMRYSFPIGTTQIHSVLLYSSE